MRSTCTTSGARPLRLSAMRTRKVASERQNENSFMGHSVRRSAGGGRILSVSGRVSCALCVDFGVDAIRRPPAGQDRQDVVVYYVRHLLAQLGDRAAEMRGEHHVAHGEPVRLDGRL